MYCIILYTLAQCWNSIIKRILKRQIHKNIDIFSQQEAKMSAKSERERTKKKKSGWHLCIYYYCIIIYSSLASKLLWLEDVIVIYNWIFINFIKKILLILLYSRYSSQVKYTDSLTHCFYNPFNRRHNMCATFMCHVCALDNRLGDSSYPMRLPDNSIPA